MAYLPLSNITRKSTSISGDKLYIKTNNQPYEGLYIETVDGEFYAGHSNVSLGPALIKKPTSATNSNQTKPFGSFRQSRVYNIIKPKIKDFLKDKEPISINKPVPTNNDYIRGHFTRYFLKRINEVNYKEIDKITYENIKNKNPKYDYNLYEVGRIKWQLIGNDIHKQNSRAISKTKNLINLFPILNEYSSPSKKIQENLNTLGGELYYANGSEYVGPYHIHPEIGPMVGATHKSTPHKTLYYIKNLPKLDTGNSYEDFLKEYDKIDCYKCVSTNKGSQVISSTKSRMIGCPSGTYTTYEEALEACPSKTNNTTSVNNRPTEGGTSSSEETYGGGGVSSGGGGVSSGGGTSGGGGGGY